MSRNRLVPGPRALPTSVRVVFVRSLEAQLASGMPPDQLLHNLAGGDKLLESPAADTQCGLISYRQERDCGDPALTLDGLALTSVVAAAKRGGLDALWLD
eukprot:3741859-Prymnesium_polylepis.1